MAAASAHGPAVATSAHGPLFAAAPSKCLFPIDPRWKGVWDMYKTAVANIWTVEEVDLATDPIDYETKLNDDERHFLDCILGFFAAGDTIVNENLTANFTAEIRALPVLFFYQFQEAIENIHSEMYSLMIDTIVRDPARKDELFNAITRIPSVAHKAAWADRWMNRDMASIGERLVAFACVEGIFFSGAFCAIFWFKKRGLMPGLTLSNEWIARDEGLHRDFACLLVREHLEPGDRPTEARVREIVREAVDIEIEFVTESLPVSLIGMNVALMAQYMRFVADHLLVTLGFSRMYGDTNPFPWMDLISLEGKPNFFETRNSQYKRADFDPRQRVATFEAEF